MARTIHLSVFIAATFVAAPCRAQDSAPAEAEGYERGLREERARHRDAIRKLDAEEERLRAAIAAAKGRESEAAARRAGVARLAADASARANAAQARAVAARRALEAIAAVLDAAALRHGIAASALPSPDVSDAPARRIRQFFQTLDQKLAAARRVTVTPLVRGDALGDEVRLGALATFFVPASGASALLLPGGRVLPDAVGVALREIVRQQGARGRSTLVLVPWWGMP